MTIPHKLTVNAVSKTYRLRRHQRLTAIESASFSVKPFETLALLGPSGCGKSTLLRLIAGLEQPSSGELRINNRLIKGHGVSRLYLVSLANGRR